jgi:hypothetical protein
MQLSLQYDDQYDAYAENIVIENEADGGILISQK